MLDQLPWELHEGHNFLWNLMESHWLFHSVPIALKELCCWYLNQETQGSFPAVIRHVLFSRSTSSKWTCDICWLRCRWFVSVIPQSQPKVMQGPLAVTSTKMVLVYNDFLSYHHETGFFKLVFSQEVLWKEAITKEHTRQTMPWCLLFCEKSFNGRVTSWHRVSDRDV